MYITKAKNSDFFIAPISRNNFKIPKVVFYCSSCIYLKIMRMLLTNLHVLIYKYIFSSVKMPFARCSAASSKISSQTFIAFNFISSGVPSTK
nr:MAG TPA: hypothetical protein [Caudoviricetes sp.]